MGEYRLEQEGILIETRLPLQSLQKMRLKEEPDGHNFLKIEAMVEEARKQEVVEKNWQGTEILVAFLGEKKETLFWGKLDKLRILRTSSGMVVRLIAKASTILLDRGKKSRSFQKTNMTYRQIIQEVISDYPCVDFRWGEKEDREIQEPVIQYEETDWKFLQRLSSHFSCCLVGQSNSRGAICSFGMKKEKERQLTESECIGWGIDQSYYENGGYEAGLPISAGHYLLVEIKENWNLGDYIIYKGSPFLVYEKDISFRQGELQFTYRMAGDGLFYRKKFFNQLLAGVHLEGMVRRVEGEQVYIQLDIDKGERADYPWKWAPQTNTMSYCMPEVNTRVSLCFSDNREKNGQAVWGKWRKEIFSYKNVQNREFTTVDKKKLGLYPKELFLEGKAGSTELVLEDTLGIWIGSKKGISFQAAGAIHLKGRQIFVLSPQEVVCRTPVSNIELCRDINLFAPGGVQTIGIKDTVGRKGKTEEKDGKKSKQLSRIEGWQEAYMALAAVPSVDFSRSQKADCAIDVVVTASIPKIGSGQAVYAMAEVMDGKKESESSFPGVFKSMDNYTVKGGYLLPKEEKEK